MLIVLSFAENILILSELKGKLFNDQFLMNFSRKMFEEITEIEINHRIFDCDIKVGLDEMLSRFTGLQNLRLSCIQYPCINALTFPNIDTLKILGCTKEKIENYEFEGLKSLRVLEFRHNSTSIICSQVFHSLSFLEKLDISHNILEELPDNIFSQLSNLKSLNLSYNLIKIIKKSTLAGLENLEHFCFENQSKTVFQKNAFEDLDNLKNLKIKFYNNFRGQDSGSDEGFNYELAYSYLEFDPPKNLEQAELRFDCVDSSFLRCWLNSANNLKILALRFNERKTINNSFFNN